MLLGGTGNDELNGGAGDDRLTGGAGDDTFVFQGGGGSDAVPDFEVDHDIVRVQQGINGLAINSPEDIASLVFEDGGNAVIDFGNGDTLTLVGVSADDVQAPDPSKSSWSLISPDWRRGFPPRRHFLVPS